MKRGEGGLRRDVLGEGERRIISEELVMVAGKEQSAAAGLRHGVAETDMRYPAALYSTQTKLSVGNNSNIAYANAAGHTLECELEFVLVQETKAVAGSLDNQNSEEEGQRCLTDGGSAAAAGSRINVAWRELDRPICVRFNAHSVRRVRQGIQTAHTVLDCWEGSGGRRCKIAPTPNCQLPPEPDSQLATGWLTVLPPEVDSHRLCRYLVIAEGYEFAILENTIITIREICHVSMEFFSDVDSYTFLDVRHLDPATARWPLFGVNIYTRREMAKFFHAKSRKRLRRRACSGTAGDGVEEDGGLGHGSGRRCDGGKDSVEEVDTG
uniref:Uncharacterized protein n=1 Tax=Oryza sativa subsp. japonica TaxID=39947 RepID=Q8LHU1_ORYSJ|nr:hypothetical protein [Oryza sativa Japonica Group]